MVYDPMEDTPDKHREEVEKGLGHTKPEVVIKVKTWRFDIDTAIGRLFKRLFRKGETK